ncbi:MAG: benzoate-CoA ligase family protein [Gemmatimonadota bacterium]
MRSPRISPGSTRQGPLRASDLPAHYNAVELLEWNLEGRAEKVALCSPSRELTFRQVCQEVNRLGNGLRALGVRPGDRVGILAPDSPEWAVSFFACLKIGAVATGLNTLLRPHEYAYMLRDGHVRVLIASARFLVMLREISGEIDAVEWIVAVGADGESEAAAAGVPLASGGCGPRVLEWDACLAGQSSELEAERTHREDYGTLNYSSGTTGAPKGIFHAHQDYALTARLWGVDVLGLRETDRTFSIAKLFFAYGLGGNLLFPWSVGASTVVYPGSPRDTERVLEAIGRFRPTILYNAPTGYAAMLASPELERSVGSLRLCVSAGESLPAPLWHEWKERTGIDIIDGIGSTELFHIFISNRPDDIRPGCSGKPVPGYEARVVDERGRAVGPGQVGSLHIKGESAALSYLHQCELGRKTFLGEWVSTGDQYRVDEDGYYWHAGRSDDMLKVGGIWVSPVEVESTLIGHPAVSECAVVGVVDAAGLIKPKAWVRLGDGHAPSEELARSLIAYCREQMAAYKRPRWIEFVEELPKTATGKIQRFRLREAGAPRSS